RTGVDADEQDVLSAVDRHVGLRRGRIQQIGPVEVVHRGVEDQLVADDHRARGEHQQRTEDHEQPGPQRILGPAAGLAAFSPPGRRAGPLPVRRLLVTISVEHRARRVLQCRLLVSGGGPYRPLSGATWPLYGPRGYSCEPVRGLSFENADLPDKPTGLFTT